MQINPFGSKGPLSLRQDLMFFLVHFNSSYRQIYRLPSIVLQIHILEQSLIRLKSWATGLVSFARTAGSADSFQLYLRPLKTSY